MQNYPAMDAIKASVHPRYYVWYKPTRAQIEAAEKKKRLNIHSEIFNRALEPRRPHERDDLKDSLKHLLNIPKIEIDQLKTATNDWDVTNELGRGGFGIVYKGEYLNTKVAIKKLNLQTAKMDSKNHWVQSLKQSMNELRILNKCRGDNILPIYGYSIAEDACFVVFQLMEGGSLEERLSKTGRKGFPPLDWRQRYEIAKGTARQVRMLRQF